MPNEIEKISTETQQQIEPVKRKRGNPNFAKGKKNPYNNVVPAPRTELTVKQRKYKNYVLSGMPKSQALRKAGYSKTLNSSAIEASPKLQKAMLQALTKVGIDDNFLAQKMKQGIMATDKKFFAFEGKVIETRKVPDFPTREKYLRDILEVRGDIKNTGVDSISVGVIVTPPESSDWAQKKIEIENVVSADGK